MEGPTSVAAAVDALHAAVAGLVDPIKATFGGVVRVAPSWYDQLVGEVALSGGREKSRRGVPGSRPVVFLDALELAADIDATARSWHPAGDGTPARLRALAAARWRPQDVRAIVDRAERIAAWRVAIDAMLNPEPVKTIAAPCPACNQRWVYRRQDGENVRRPALQLIAEQGCRCHACGTSWPPSHYLHLCRLLGFDLPPGISA